MFADLILRRASTVVTCAGPVPRRGRQQRDIAALHDATVASFEGTIVFVGPAAEAEQAIEPTPEAKVLEVGAGSVLPGFVDPHTHVCFAGDRRDELRRRLAGAGYAEIAGGGGGILKTMRDTREASEEQLTRETRRRLDEMLAAGTTTCEAKSGYGLETEAELKQLRVIRALNASHPIDLVPTFLGAHEVPPEYRHQREDYVALVVDEMIPAVAREELAEWCDVFCEEGVFTPDESARILRAGQAAGLKARIHADELAASGGSHVAALVGARSADHLVHVDPAGVRALARAGVVATLLPGAAFYLKLGRFAPARMLIDSGVPVALATDVNPGGGFSPSMPFMIALACFGMQMTLEEAIIASTINAAYALDRHDRIGSLETGKQMDAVILRDDPIDLVRAGAGIIAAVIKNGRIL